uniref:Uncharacterized protein n=1 Tax=Aegilops tauschii subsp. strangulata TaxID=200361 RepID=A0A453T410_AEGTS
MARMNLAVSLIIMETMSYIPQRNLRLVTLSPFLKYTVSQLDPDLLHANVASELLPLSGTISPIIFRIKFSPRANVAD